MRKGPRLWNRKMNNAPNSNQSAVSSTVLVTRRGTRDDRDVSGVLWGHGGRALKQAGMPQGFLEMVMPELCLKVEKEWAGRRQSKDPPEGRNSIDKGSGEEHPGGQRDCKQFKSCWRLTCQVGRSVEVA